MKLTIITNIRENSHVFLQPMCSECNKYKSQIEIHSSLRQLRWIVFGRHCSRRRSRRGGRRGWIVIVLSTFPSSPVEDQRAEACNRGPWLSPPLRWWLVVTMACCGGGRGGYGFVCRWRYKRGATTAQKHFSRTKLLSESRYCQLWQHHRMLRDVLHVVTSP